MPRVIWKGSISFGLVTIPVQLFSAVSRKTVRFNQLDAETGARVRYKKVSSADDSELPSERIVKGYELPSGDYVTVTEAEFEQLAPVAARTIDIDAFIDLADIDPVFFDSAYHLVPDEATAKPYKLLAEAMGEANKVGICHFVMRSKQHLAAIRPVDGRLMLSTMVYADELVAPEELGGLDSLGDIEVDERETAMARQLITALESDFEPDRYTDSYREALLELIERKASGDTTATVAAPAPSSDTVVDLMAALEASVAAAKEARKRHPAVAGENAPAPSEASADGEASEPEAGQVRRSA
ncbi:MAG: Ku protein [Acidimicrobiaceae bacterium]|nr:Ku protein [Acidimicrobiaceae bacterium]